jgi:myo-inositol 2-dehydrogenase/D-chiro-inositol 1-dehydrogenase
MSGNDEKRIAGGGTTGDGSGSGGGRMTRRRFMRGAAAAGAAATVGAPSILGAAAKGKGRTVKVGLIGCGGRGRGALASSVQAGKVLDVDVRVAGLADYFKDRAERAGQRHGVPKSRCFGGADSYRKLLETDVELVLMAAAPLFRPLHLEACVKAGRHAFIEKPVAVDPPGCRRVIAAGELARKKGLVVMAGTEMRQQRAFVDTHQAVAVEKALGRLQAGRVSFCMGHMFHRKPIEPKTADDLIRSWQDWVCLSGDHLVEQHVHNIDVANWFAGRPPVSAVGFGGRARRNAGDMFDFFSVDYDYGEGVHVHSMCRQVQACWNWVGHDLVYEKGHTNGSDGPKPKRSRWPADLPVVRGGSAQEQVNVLYHLGKGKPRNEAKAVAESSAAAVLGRTSTYTGQMVTWRDMMEDASRKPDVYNLTLRPTAEDFQTGNVAIPPEGKIALPGRPPGARQR